MSTQTLFKWTNEKWKKQGPSYVDLDEIAYVIERVVPGEERLMVWLKGSMGEDDEVWVKGEDNIARLKRHLKARVAPEVFMGPAVGRSRGWDEKDEETADEQLSREAAEACGE